MSNIRTHGAPRRYGDGGYAWPSNWKSSLDELVASRGFGSVGAYADAYPLVTTWKLANDLDRDVSVKLIEAALIAEARAAHDVERRARDLMARSLAAMPDGWPGPRRTNEQEWPAVAYAAGWLPRDLAEVKMAHIVGLVTFLLGAELPPGWRPSGADDPVIVEAFRQHWPR
jgi:hypothetical protein